MVKVQKDAILVVSYVGYLTQELKAEPKMVIKLSENSENLEEDRWATLLRNKPEEWQQRIMNYATYTASASAKKYPEVRRWSEFQGPIQFKNWPIPQTYIDLNTGADFPQNTGW